MDSDERVARVLKRKRVADMRTLRQMLSGRSRRSVFRDLERVGYLSSYTHSGRFYTLRSIPRFDDAGLWFCDGVGFSRAGTLKETVALQVEQAAEGRTHDELRNLLRVRVHNTLLGLVREDRIGREPLGKVFLYVSADRERAAEQISERMNLRAVLREALRFPTDEEVVEVLVEALRAAPEIPRPDEVSRHLGARGIRLEPRHVEQVYEEHHLEPGKKTARRNLRR